MKNRDYSYEIQTLKKLSYTQKTLYEYIKEIGLVHWSAINHDTNIPKTTIIDNCKILYNLGLIDIIRKKNSRNIGRPLTLYKIKEVD